jgi:hypothetical protein
MAQAAERGRAGGASARNTELELSQPRALVFFIAVHIVNNKNSRSQLHANCSLCLLDEAVSNALSRRFNNEVLYWLIYLLLSKCSGRSIFNY